MSTRIVYRSRRNFTSETGVRFSFNDYIDEHAWQLLPEMERGSFRREKHEGEIKDLNRALTRAQDPATKTNSFYKRVLDSSIESAHYKLMIYFAHSTMVIYNKSVISHDKMTVEEFREANESLCDRVVKEAMNLFSYELSLEQMNRAIYVYLQSKYYSKAVDQAEPYTIPS